MKRTVAFLVCMILAFSLLSCGKQTPQVSLQESVRPIATLPATTEERETTEKQDVETVEKTTYPSATVPISTKESTAWQETTQIETVHSEVTEPITETTESTTSAHFPEQQTKETLCYPSVKPFSEAPTRVLYINSGTLYYHSKITGDEAVFCFDPLCPHTWESGCVSQKFQMAGSMQTIEYCPYNRRFYALRGEQFCSFAFDGSDLRVEHSFGEAGKFDNSPIGIYPYGGLLFLQVSGENVFFLAKHKDTGKQMLMRFSAATNQMHTVFYDKNTNISGYLIGDETVYISLVGNYTGLYQMNIKGQNMVKISDEVYDSLRQGVFFNDTLYFANKKSTGDMLTTVPDKIVALSVSDNRMWDVVKVEDGALDCFVLAVSDSYVYYTVRDDKVIGYKESTRGRFDVINQCSKIYRFDKRNGKTVTVLNDIHFDTDFLYFFDDKALVIGTKCTPGEGNANREDGVFVFKLDENGIFH